MTEKHYDRAYFDHWYRGRNRVSAKEDVRRKVALAVAECEYFIRRRLRSVLDVACGEGSWQPHIKELRPSAKYLGLDPSDYAVSRFGAKRNIRKAGFADLTAARLRGPFDLVVCSDALHYINDDDIRTGLHELVRVAGGVLFLEVLTADDDIIGDLNGMIRRPAAWYRKLFEKAGLTAAGPYTWLAPHLREDAAALEALR
ncbi:MAG: class I SAM-dependent DNA methyltransferase [Thermoanaerobaculia bacterium]